MHNSQDEKMTQEFNVKLNYRNLPKSPKLKS